MFVVSGVFSSRHHNKIVSQLTSAHTYHLKPTYKPCSISGSVYACRADDMSLFTAAYGGDDKLNYMVKVGFTKRLTRMRIDEQKKCFKGEVFLIHEESGFKDAYLAEQLAHVILSDIGNDCHLKCDCGFAKGHTEFFVPKHPKKGKVNTTQWIEIVTEVLKWVRYKAPAVLATELKKHKRVMV